VRGRAGEEAEGRGLTQGPTPGPVAQVLLGSERRGALEESPSDLTVLNTQQACAY
jgi:hypothetical protein